jgi:hypothetical protein
MGKPQQFGWASHSFPGCAAEDQGGVRFGKEAEPVRFAFATGPKRMKLARKLLFLLLVTLFLFAVAKARASDVRCDGRPALT